MKRKAWKERGRQALAVALSAAMLMPSAGIAVQVNAANAAGEAKKDSAKNRQKYRLTGQRKIPDGNRSISTAAGNLSAAISKERQPLIMMILPGWMWDFHIISVFRMR